MARIVRFVYTNIKPCPERIAYDPPAVAPQPQFRCVQPNPQALRHRTPPELLTLGARHRSASPPARNGADNTFSDRTPQPGHIGDVLASDRCRSIRKSPQLAQR
jgi:hypothetical protein